jgi:hypothetical protein
MARYTFQKNTLYSDLLLDFKSPFDVAKHKCITPKIQNKIQTPIEDKRPRGVRGEKYPMPLHFWAFTTFLRNRLYQERIDKCIKLPRPPHFIAYHRHRGSNIGGKVLKYICPKITPLWMAEMGRSKNTRRSHRPPTQVPILEDKYKTPFLRIDVDKIHDNYITISFGNGKPPDGKTIFRIRDLL